MMRSIVGIILYFLAVLVSTLFWLMATTALAVKIFSDLPRPVAFQPPPYPRWLFMLMLLVVQVAGPVTLAYAGQKTAARRISLIAAMVVAMSFFYGRLQIIDILDQAWRQGL